MGLLTVLTVKKFEFPKSKMADGRPFEKKPVKSSYFSNRRTDFDEIWHGDANWPPTGDTHTRLTALCPGLPGRAGTRKVNQSGFY